MGLDMYLEKRKIIATNGGSYCDMNNPRVDTVEITSVGYWRKKYELDDFIAEIVGDTERSNCKDWYMPIECVEQVIEEANKRIVEIPQEIKLLEHQQKDKRINKETKLNLEWKINDKKWELSGWENALKVFTQAKQELMTDPDVDYYYSRWY